MDENVERAVENAIAAMRDRLGEPITIDDMARAAIFSKFHFCRVFQQATGVSPRRFLSAMRLQEAKRLLLATSLSVTDISNRVGYASVGTFSRRFKDAVGLAPTEYRRLGGHRRFMALDGGRCGAGRQSAVIRGEIRPSPAGAPGPTLVGLFPDRIQQGHPVRYVILQHPGPYALDRVPPGTWHLLAHSGHGPDDAGDRPSAVAGHGPMTIQPDTVIVRADLQLRPMHTLDPPVLLPFPVPPPAPPRRQVG
jgi:AraC family transcriptional regulator